MSVCVCVCTCVVGAVDDGSHWETQWDAELGSRWTTTSCRRREHVKIRDTARSLWLLRESDNLDKLFKTLIKAETVLWTILLLIYIFMNIFPSMQTRSKQTISPEHQLCSSLNWTLLRLNRKELKTTKCEDAPPAETSVPDVSAHLRFISNISPKNLPGNDTWPVTEAQQTSTLQALN